VKALRHYDEIGLLRPAHVDEGSGYRYYALAQVRVAEAIRRLRALEVPLDEARRILAEPERTRERLAVHRARIEGRAVETKRILAELNRLIDGKESLVPEREEVRVRFRLNVQDVDEQRVVVIAERARSEDLKTAIPQAIAQVRSYLDELGIEPTGPPLTICPFPDDEGMLTHETGWPVAGDVPGRGDIGAKTLPATRALVLQHQGPYELLSRSYRLLSEAMQEHGLTPAGDPIEIYETDPEVVADPNDYETTIVWPIGPEGELKPKRDVFKKRVEHD
jgi:effector-binding domain-containing protein